MNHFLSCAFVAALSFGHQGSAQVAQPLQAPRQAKGISLGPTGQTSNGTGVFFDPALALEAGQWNPTITLVHKPLPERVEDINEKAQKTQAKLELIQQKRTASKMHTTASPTLPLARNGRIWVRVGSPLTTPEPFWGRLDWSAKNSKSGITTSMATSGEWSLSASSRPCISPTTLSTILTLNIQTCTTSGLWLPWVGPPNNTNVLVAFSISNKADGFWMFNLGGNCSPGNVWFDYPKTAVGETELFVTGNLFNNDGIFQQATIYQIGLADAWTGGSISYQWYCNVPDATGFSSLASSIVPLGSAWTAPSPGITLVAQWEGSMTYYHIDNSLDNNPILTAFPVSGDVFATTAGDVVQLGSSQTLDGGGNRLRDGFFYDGTIHVVHNVAGSDGFWKLRYAQIDFDSGEASVFDDFGATGFDYNYPSIDPWGATGSDWDGSVVLGFWSSSSIYPD